MGAPSTKPQWWTLSARSGESTSGELQSILARTAPSCFVIHAATARKFSRFFTGPHLEPLWLDNSVIAPGDKVDARDGEVRLVRRLKLDMETALRRWVALDSLRPPNHLESVRNQNHASPVRCSFRRLTRSKYVRVLTA